jgi:hypothetical protein
MLTMKISVIRTVLTLMMIAAWSATAQAQLGASTGSNLLGNGGTSGIGSATSLGSGSSIGTRGLTTGGTTGTTATSTNAAQQFIGGNATQSFVGGAREASNQQAMNRQFQAFQNSQNTATTSQSQTGTPREIRTVLAIGFSFPSATTAQQSGRLADVNAVNLNRFAANRPEFAGMSVSMTPEGVAVLNGSAPSVESSRLAANLMRFQPGVRKVENRLNVAQ